MTIQEARKLMGKSSENYTNEQLQKIIDELIQLARIIIEYGILEKI